MLGILELPERQQAVGFGLQLPPIAYAARRVDACQQGRDAVFEQMLRGFLQITAGNDLRHGDRDDYIW